MKHEKKSNPASPARETHKAGSQTTAPTPVTPPPAPIPQKAPPADSKPTEPVKTEYQSPEERLQAQGVQERGKAILTALGEVGTKYLDLCTYVREHKVAPRLVSIELGNLGFKRSRVSEIVRIANAADDVWDAFQARRLGFKDALELARATDGKTPHMTDAGRLLLDKGQVGQEDIDAEARSIMDDTKGKGKHTTESQLAKQKVLWLLRKYANPKENTKKEPKKFTNFKDFPGWSVNIVHTH